jgi:hypothetical protein
MVIDVNDVDMYGYLEYILKTRILLFVQNVRVRIGTSQKCLRND